MQCHSALHAHTNRGDLMCGHQRTCIFAWWHPHSRTTRNEHRLYSVASAHRDECLLDPPHHRDTITAVRKFQNRVANKLTRAVPGNPPSSIHIDDSGTIVRAVLGLCPTSRRVDERVLYQQKRVGNFVPNPPPRQLVLVLPNALVILKTKGFHPNGDTIC